MKGAAIAVKNTDGSKKTEERHVLFERLPVGTIFVRRNVPNIRVKLAGIKIGGMYYGLKSSTASREENSAASPARAVRSMIKAAFREARVPNWDGQSGQPVSKATRNMALRFIRAALCLAESAPAVSVTPNGGLYFQWRQGQERLSVSVYGEGRLVFASRTKDGPTSGERRFDRAVPNPIRGLLREF